MKVKKSKSTLGLEYLIIDLARQTLESAFTSAEITGYRSVWGHLLWLGKQSRPDLCVGVSRAAQGLSKVMRKRRTNWLIKREAQQKWALSFLVA